MCHRTFGLVPGLGVQQPHAWISASTGISALGCLLLLFCLVLVLICPAEAAKLEDRIIAVVNKDLIMLSE